MNHLESTFTGRNSLWRYVVMLAAVLIAANTVGAIPLLIALFAKSASDPNVLSQLAANPNDYSVLGLDTNAGLAMMLFPFIAALGAFILLVKPLNSRNILLTINGTGTVRWNRFFIAAAVWLLLSAVYFLVYLKADPQNFSLSVRNSPLIVLVAISLLLIPFQAAFEETLFRGYLMQGFTALLAFRWFPLLMSSVLFGLMHAFNPEVSEYGFFTMMPQYILFGLIFGIITVLDDGIEAAIGAHAANNIFLCIMVTNDSSALQTAALYEQHRVYPWMEFLGLLVSGILFILILKVVFGWKDFGILFRKVERGLTPDQIS